MSIHLRRVIRSLALFGVLGAMSAPAFALVAYLDSVKVMRDGVLYGEDTFDDGIPPPSGPYGDPMYLYTKGTMTEANGKLKLDTSKGDLGTNFKGYPTYTLRATGNTDNSSDPHLGLKPGHSFSFTATYDFIGVAGMKNGESYGMRFADRGNSGIQSEAVMLSVSKNGSGSTRIMFQKNDFLTGVQTDIAGAGLSSVIPSGGADQIALTLSDNNADQFITASFSFLRGGSSISGGTFVSTTTIFNADSWTRPEFSVSAPVPEPEIWAMMLAGCGLMGWMARRRREPAVA